MDVPQSDAPLTYAQRRALDAYYRHPYERRLYRLSQAMNLAMVAAAAGGIAWREARLMPVAAPQVMVSTVLTPAAGAGPVRSVAATHARPADAGPVRTVQEQPLPQPMPGPVSPPSAPAPTPVPEQPKPAPGPKPPTRLARLRLFPDTAAHATPRDIVLDTLGGR
jgi:hypothetical protein